MKFSYCNNRLKAAQDHVNYNNHHLAFGSFDVEKFLMESLEAFKEDGNITSRSTGGVTFTTEYVDDDYCMVDITITPCYNDFDYVELEVL